MTKAVSRAAASMASSKVSSVTELTTVKLSGQPGFRLQRLTGWLGSASIDRYRCAPAGEFGREQYGEVDLPAPPFELAKEMVGIASKT